MIALLLAATSTASLPRIDQTADIAVVADFLADVRAGKAAGAGIEVLNYQDRRLANFPAFVAYSRECQLASVSAVASATRPLPISAKWDCGRYIKIDGKLVWEERSAGFWVKNGRVVKLTFDKGPTIVVPTPKANTNG